MAGLSEPKRHIVRQLVERAPESVLKLLDGAFAGPGKAEEIRTMIALERRDREARAAVYEPLLPMFAPAREEGVGVRFSPGLPATLWRLLAQRRPAVAAGVIRALRDRYDEMEPAPIALDVACAASAALLRAEPEACGCTPDVAADLAAYMDLAPVARRALPYLEEWLGRTTEERTVALRVLVQDAVAVAEDATPRLLEILSGHLPEPFMVLRLVDLITDHGGEAFVAASELGPLGERLIADVECCAARFAARARSAESAATAAGGADLVWLTGALEAFRVSIETKQGGPWAGRLTAARTQAVEALEARLNKVEAAVGKALPMEKVRIAGSMTRPAPKVGEPPNPALVETARAGLILLAAVRNTATALGCGSLRTKVAEATAARIDNYAEEALQMLNDDGPPGHAVTFAELAADFLGLARDPDAARLVRRRIAAISARPTETASQRVA